MKPENVPRLIWRIVGLAVLVLGLLALALGIFIGIGYVNELIVSSKEDIEGLAISFSLLSGLGIVMLFSGFNLLLIEENVTKINLVPWQALITSGLLITLSIVITIFYSVTNGHDFNGASAKGLSMILGLAISFIASGWYQKKKKVRALFK